MFPVLLVAAALELSNPPTGAELARLLWDNAPDLQAARARVAQARADVERAGLLPNPQLDVGVGALPVGPQTPGAMVETPWLEVPNASVGVSELIELGKRGPRQASASAALEATLHDARAQLLQRYWEVRANLGEVAAAQARIAELAALTQDAERLAGLQRARADRGDTSQLDADRAALEVEKFSSTLGAEQEHLVAELRDCAALVGVRCSAFEGPEAASQYLSAIEAPGTSLGDRPDVRALVASEASQRAAQLLAERHAIPDPTVRVGYLRDQYVASGNWQNSFFAGVSIPLPVFDRNQPEARAAAAAAESSRRARERTLVSAKEQLERVAAQKKSVDGRRAQLRGKALPLAREVVARLDAAVLRGAASIQDVLLARRTLVELQLLANDLDLAGFHARLDEARLSGALPFVPEELVP
ncbi:MAG: TolC family protein [Myxococcaceae bacterium]|nr:TolC family protein [Myxococcaceae bacterium]